MSRVRIHKIIFPAFFLFCVAACRNHPAEIPKIQPDDSVAAAPPVTDSSLQYTPFPDNPDWQARFHLTHDPNVDTVWGQPVSYYLENPKCSRLAREFYYGRFRPGDDDSTARLLALVTTDDDSLRPFYRWCLNKTINIQDGALADYTGVPARQYAEKFPEEFFEYLDYDTTGQKYNLWVGSIQYSGLYRTDDYRNPQRIRQNLAREMNRNCIDCNEQLKARILKFAADCFR